MSQQINLYNAALRQSKDWLSFRNLVVGASVSLAAVALSFGYATWEMRKMERAQAEVGEQLKSLQEQAKTMGNALAERKSDAAIAKELERLTIALSQRQTAFQVLASGDESTQGVADYMQGFAKQSMDGVWLTGFRIHKGEMEIRGRLLKASLLPEYIRRLNAEPAFRGRRFSTLDMKAGERDGGQSTEGHGLSAAVQANVPRYLEFVLQSSGMPQDSRKGGGR